jgi:hypothetical protein
MDNFCHMKGSSNFAHLPVLDDKPFTGTGNNSITNGKELDIQNIAAKLAAILGRTKNQK